MRDVLLPLDPTLGRRDGLEKAIRNAIRAGTLTPGTVMASTRALAADYGFARATVVAAYEQLAIEGYLVARQGVGTVVANLNVLAQAVKPEESTEGATWYDVPPADFRPGEPDSSSFPRASWIRSLKRVVNNSADSAFGYAEPKGRHELRRALTEYLGRTRAVHAEPNAVSLFTGVTASFGFIGEALRSLGIERVAMEDPTLFILRQVLELVGLTAVPVPLDTEGIDVDALVRLDVGAVFVTPAHQYPMGITMSPARRAQLVEWARTTSAWIIEDDYDGEFRYDRQPIGALQGLDPTRVLYLGTASKNLSPGLRLSWAVVPDGLRRPLARVKHLRGLGSTIEQLALADFIERGELDRQLRSTRTLYQDRRHAVGEIVAEHAPWLALSDAPAGLHFAATITDPSISEATVMQAATAGGVGFLPLGPHWAAEATSAGVVVGYSRPAAHQFNAATDRLRDVLKSISAEV